jgi:hypothetical protein
VSVLLSVGCRYFLKQVEAICYAPPCKVDSFLAGERNQKTTWQLLSAIGRDEAGIRFIVFSVLVLVYLEDRE